MKYANIDEQTGLITLIGTSCPFCGNKKIAYTEADGKMGEKETVSISTACYFCHTVKFVSFLLLKEYGDGNIGNWTVKPEQRELHTEKAKVMWDERPTGTVSTIFKPD